MDSLIVISQISNSVLILFPMNKAIILQPGNGHQLSSGGQLKQLGAMSHPRARTNASCQSISVSQHAPAFVLLFGFFHTHFNHRGHLLLEFPEGE